MVFAQLTWREGLRDIVECLNARRETLYHLGFSSPVARSTLAEANEWMRKNRPDALRIAEDHAFDGGGVGFDAQWNSAFQATLSSFVRGNDATRDLTLFATELERLDGLQWVNFAECHDSAGDLNRHHRLPAYIDPATPNSLRARALALLRSAAGMSDPALIRMWLARRSSATV